MHEPAGGEVAPGPPLPRCPVVDDVEGLLRVLADVHRAHTFVTIGERLQCIDRSVAHPLQHQTFAGSVAVAMDTMIAKPAWATVCSVAEA